MLVTPDLGLEAPAGTPKEMLSRTLLPDGRKHFKINSSSLGILNTCLRKAELSLYRNLRSQVESPALTFGSAVHKALEIFYSGTPEERVLPPNLSREADLLLADESPREGLIFKALRGFLTRAQSLRSLPDSDKRSLSAGLWTLRHYFETYIDDPFVVVRDEQGPITERMCEHILFEDSEFVITLFGTIDVVLSNSNTGLVLPCDHKTSSIVGSEFYNRLKPNHQYTAYVWLTQKVLKLETEGFLVNCLQVKPRPTTSRGTPPHFLRQVTRRTSEDVEEFTQVVLHAVRLYDSALESGIWPMADVNACSMYGGCSYLQVCAAPKSLRENILKANYANQLESSEV